LLVWDCFRGGLEDLSPGPAKLSLSTRLRTARRGTARDRQRRARRETVSRAEENRLLVVFNGICRRAVQMEMRAIATRWRRVPRPSGRSRPCDLPLSVPETLRRRAARRCATTSQINRSRLPARSCSGLRPIFTYCDCSALGLRTQKLMLLSGLVFVFVPRSSTLSLSLSLSLSLER
jgi:hypothetical protein